MSFFKQVIKSFSAAFSVYSKIPMPHFKLESEDMKYHLCFFPFVGAVIAGVEILWLLFCSKYLTDSFIFEAVAISVPVLITGGFHVDGFMDTMDAIHSYADRNKRLEILKDPHVGAFAVISVILLFLLSLGFVGVIDKKALLYVFPPAFIISRILSGLSVLLFPKAKKDGMLYSESLTKSTWPVSFVLIIELIFIVATCFFVALKYCLLYYCVAQLCAVIFSFFYYYFMGKKIFGGITGDIAGFFVCIMEFLSLFSLAFVSIILRVLGA